MTGELERLTHALTRPEIAAAAAEALAGDCRPAAVEGLVELLLGEHSSRAGAAAVAALEKCTGPLVLDGLAAALGSPHAPVRLAAVAALHRRGGGGGEAHSRSQEVEHPLPRALWSPPPPTPPPRSW
jgi:HEAT repeat protein